MTRFGDLPDASSARPLRELAAVFLKLGVIGFGGPAAHIALMRGELVDRRRWLSGEQFLDLIGAANLIPGPNSTEVAIHVGRLRAGTPGLIVAGTAFILPAFCIVAAVGWAYQRVGRLPATAAVMHGITPVMIVIVLQALAGLSRTAVKSVWWAVVGAVALVAALTRVLDEVQILAIVGTGAGAIVWLRIRKVRREARSLLAPLWMLGVAPAVQGATAATPVALWPLFLVFAKAGALLFGSGYVLLAFLRTDLVERLGWLTNAQLLDAIAVGQATPGPVFTTATFIGYNLAGMTGAVVATVGIFLPAFVFVAISAPFIAVMRRSPVAGAVLDGVNVASLALMGAVTFALARDALTSAGAVAIAAVAAVLLFRYRVNPTILILGGAIAGLLLL
ncbi:MAG TPA: chromate efflux transporter [Vicinamibacterales bacterium]